MCKDDVVTSNELIFDNSIATEKPQSISSMISQFNGTPLKGIIAEVEKEIILDKLEKFQGNVAQVASSLDIGKTALYDKLKRYDISAKELR
jgi:Nif-specific regulatory protein